VAVPLLLYVSIPLTAGIFHAQGTGIIPESRLSFDAASIRPITAGQTDPQKAPLMRCRGIDGEMFANPNGPPSTVPVGRCTGLIASVADLITFAYASDVNAAHHFRVENVPKELDTPSGPDSIMYVIEAVAPNPSRATRADLQLMLQSLLRDRYKFKVHKEARNLDGFNMTVAKGGIKLKKATTNEVAALHIVSQDGKPFEPDGGTHSVMAKGTSSMQGLADFVDSMLHWTTGEPRPIADKTNLPGLYDITLLFNMTSPLGGQRGESPALSRPEIDPELPKALEQQLGLQLEKAKVPFDFMIIDHIEKPSEN
jgi:uncharacterized protein (TIGR03435 family)